MIYKEKAWKLSFKQVLGKKSKIKQNSLNK